MKISDKCDVILIFISSYHPFLESHIRTLPTPVQEKTRATKKRRGPRRGRRSASSEPRWS